jgi:uncharacterized protein
MSQKHDPHTLSVSSPERIEVLDVIRGFAVLGILMMNIQAIAVPPFGYANPLAYGGSTGLNYIVWFFSRLFFDTKFLSIFSLLFGVSLVLMTDRIEQRGFSSLSLYGRRLFFLFLFGLAHAYFLWFGDVLRYYAFCGFLVFFLRYKSPVLIIKLAVGLFTLYVVYLLIAGWDSYQLSGSALKNAIEGWNPSPEVAQIWLDAFRGGFGDQLPLQFEMANDLIFDWFIGDGAVLYISAMMLTGMALFKGGFFHGEWTERNYRRMLFASLFIGLPLVLLEIACATYFQWDYKMYRLLSRPLNALGSPFISLMYLSSWMLILKQQWLLWISHRLAAVGQMALTNYLMQSMICALFFYGYGLGWYGDFERTQQLLFVLAVWVTQLLYSSLWMHYFHYGPFEYIWRALTYLKFPRFQKS